MALIGFFEFQQNFRSGLFFMNRFLFLRFRAPFQAAERILDFRKRFFLIHISRDDNERL